MIILSLDWALFHNDYPKIKTAVDAQSNHLMEKTPQEFTSGLSERYGLTLVCTLNPEEQQSVVSFRIHSHSHITIQSDRTNQKTVMKGWFFDHPSWT